MDENSSNLVSETNDHKSWHKTKNGNNRKKTEKLQIIQIKDN